MSTYRVSLWVGLLVTLAIQNGPVQGQEDPFTWSGQMVQGQVLEVKGIVGNIRAVLAPGSLAELVAVKRGEEEDFHQVAIEMAEEGDVFLSTSQRAWAKTVSGDMEVEMGAFEGGDLEFNTVSGDITLWLPADFAADVDFNTLSGDLEIDFDMSVTGERNRWIGSSVEGTIGGGGLGLSGSTISGDVNLLRRR